MASLVTKFLHNMAFTCVYYIEVDLKSEIILPIKVRLCQVYLQVSCFSKNIQGNYCTYYQYLYFFVLLYPNFTTNCRWIVAIDRNLL